MAKITLGNKKNKNVVKPKKLLTLLLILLVASIALFFVVISANRISSQTSTSPNAPASQPEAKGKNKQECGANQTLRNGRCVYTIQVENRAKKEQLAAPKKCADSARNAGCTSACSLGFYETNGTGCNTKPFTKCCAPR